MTTVQESTNGHRVLPLPGSFPDSQQETQSENSTNNNFNSLPVSPTPSTEAFPANAYYVPPSRYAPRAYPYRRDDTLDLPPETTPLPERCQFMFSDGRQCTMGRSDIHPSLCPYHSEREDQLFGTPSSGGSVVGAAFDLPELYSSCRDLTTAAGVNRALAQVFRLLAQRRISRQEAATFGHLAQLLLRSISLTRTESVAPASENEQPMIPVVERQKGSDAHPNTKPTPRPAPSFRATIGSEESLSTPSASEESLPQIARPPLDAPPAVSHALSEPAAAKNSPRINTSVAAAGNSLEINTSKIIEVKTVQNQHIYETDSRGAVRVPPSPVRGDRI